jgi:hypothetical protein
LPTIPRGRGPGWYWAIYWELWAVVGSLRRLSRVVDVDIWTQGLRIP